MTDEPDGLSIADVYEVLLQRRPSAEEVQIWTQRFASGVSMRALLEAGVNSPEFVGAYSRRAGLFVPPGHFYSPIVDVASQPRRASSPPHAIEVGLDDHLKRWNAFLPLLRDIPFPDDPGPRYRYWYKNPAFGFPDAMTYYAILRSYRPRNVIEVGSGHSSALLLDTADEHLPDTSVTFIEPHPELLHDLMRPGDRARARIISSPVQDVDSSVFRQLTANDILFIDSTHVAKTGSDVLYEVFDVLPYLAPGVLVHLHDIFWPFEYPADWVFDENRSWNETYLLRAFLMYNPHFEILFWNDFFVRSCKTVIESTYPPFLRNTCGSVWLRKR